MHDEYEIMLHHYLINRLSDNEKNKFEQHLENCTNCRIAVAEWEKIASGMQTVAQEQAFTLPPLNRASKRLPMLHVVRQPAYSFYRFSLAMIATILILVAGVVLTRIDTNSLLTGINVPVEQIAQIETLEVVLATRHITPGEIITEDDIVLFDLPMEYVPLGAITTTDMALGSIAKVPLICGQLIQFSQITEASNDRPYFVPNRILDTINTCEGVSFQPLVDNFELFEIPFAVQNIEPLAAIEPEMFVMRPYPAQLVPEHIRMAEQEFIDATALIYTPDETIITTFVIAETWLADGTFIEVPRDQILNDIMAFQFGDQLHLAGLFSFVETADRFQQAQRSPNNNHPYPKILFNEFSNNILYLSISQHDMDKVILGILDEQDSLTIDWVFDAQIPLLLMHDIHTASSVEQFP